MKLTHNAIIAFKNKKQILTRENIEEIKFDINLFQKNDIDATELVQKLKIIISQLNSATKTFELAYSYKAISEIPFISDDEADELDFVKLLKSPFPKANIL